MSLCGAVEIGGTRVAVAVGSGLADLADPVLLRTAGPHETLEAIVEALHRLVANDGKLSAIGVASFGPLDLRTTSENYGRVLDTPKPGWSGADIRGVLHQHFGVPVVIDTDVNGAAMGEGAWGATVGLKSHAYVTVGTGVGVGLVIGGSPVHGLLHPEAGHMLVRRHVDDPFKGVCPWHGDCLEGMVSGVALAARCTGVLPEQISSADPIWGIIGGYLGEALANIALVSAAERIVLGGSVGRRPELLAATRHAFDSAINGYLGSIAPAKTYIVAPGLGSVSGLAGAMLLASRLPASRHRAAKLLDTGPFT